MRFGKIAIAATTVACAALFSVGWSEQRGVSLSIESAQARVGRPLTPVSVAGVARRQVRRGAYGYGYGAGVVGAGLAAGAVGAATVAAATSPYGYYGQPYASDPNAAYASTYQGYAGGHYAESPWGYYECHPGSSLYPCQPYSHLGWYQH